LWCLRTYTLFYIRICCIACDCYCHWRRIL